MFGLSVVAISVQHVLVTGGWCLEERASRGAMQFRRVPTRSAAQQAAKSREDDARKRAAAASAMGSCFLHQSREFTVCCVFLLSSRLLNLSSRQAGAKGDGLV